MDDILDEVLTTIAFCWRLERDDGAALGITSHDRDVWIHGFRYRSTPGMAPSAVELSDGFDATMMSVSGALTSGAITEADLEAARWDGAAVTLFAVDWEYPDAAAIPVARGVLGDVRVSGNGFETELKGPAAMLERPCVEQTSPECRASLGDKRCRVDMAKRVRVTRIVGVIDEETIEVADASGEANAYGYGRLRWIGGPHSGLDSAILLSAGTRIALREPPWRTPEVGDLVELREGCDRRFETCGGRFNNAENFRGEPHLPGMDLLTRYGGAA